MGPRRGAAVAAIVVGSLLAPLAADAAQTAPPARGAPAVGLLAADSHLTLARLEARAARLSRQYRGQLVNLTAAAVTAAAATGRARRLRRKLVSTQRQFGRLAAASYMSNGLDPVLALLSGGDPQRALDRASTLEYLAQQRSAKQDRLQRLVLADSHAEQEGRQRRGRPLHAVRHVAGQVEHGPRVGDGRVEAELAAGGLGPAI